MAEAPRPPQGALDWFSQQQALFAAMTSGLTQPASAWPTLPGGFDPALQDKLRGGFARLGLAAPDAGAVLPSMADGLMGPMMNRLTQAPTFAHLWDMDQKLAGLSAAWAALHSANAAYQALVARGWAVAQQNLMKKAATADAKPTPDLRAGTDAWLGELNAALLELMRGDEYLALQKRLLDAGLQVREQLRKLGEDLAEWFQLPSRNEVDDVARAVTQLRRELRRERRRAAAPAA
jgi:hypothetical protein